MPDTYGDRVAHVRREMGLTQEEFAAEAGMPTRTLQDIETGKVARPQKQTRDKIEAVLNLRPEGQTEAEWPPDLDAYLKLEGAFLFALSGEQRAAYINARIRDLARWNLSKGE